jgi:hypothetical protein
VLVTVNPAVALQAPKEAQGNSKLVQNNMQRKRRMEQDRRAA